MQPELARLGEFAQACSQGEEVRARDCGGKIGKRERHIVDARGVQAEDIAGGGGRGGVGGGSDKVSQGAAGVVGEFCKEGLGFGFGERTHGRLSELGTIRN